MEGGVGTTEGSRNTCFGEERQMGWCWVGEDDCRWLGGGARAVGGMLGAPLVARRGQRVPILVVIGCESNGEENHVPGAPRTSGVLYL